LNNKKDTGKNRIILVIEDEKPLAEVIKLKLGANGFDVVTARSSDQAMNMMEDINHIDIVWLDHYLLGKSTGLDFLVRLKSHEEWKKIPVFVVSNTASADKVQSYLQLGVSKFYVKADNRLDEIITDVKAVLDRKEE
jgi:DNA-binding response OmpR family regulator